MARLTIYLMKSKLIITTAMILAAFGGFWLGGYRAAQTWRHYVEAVMDRDAHTANLNRAKVSLQLLSLLHNGQQPQASVLLERQLDVALIQCAAYCKTVPPPQLVGDDIGTIREARVYRSQHPWTNDPVTAESVQEVFRWAN